MTNIHKANSKLTFAEVVSQCKDGDSILFESEANFDEILIENLNSISIEVEGNRTWSARSLIVKNCNGLSVKGLILGDGTPEVEQLSIRGSTVEFTECIFFGRSLAQDQYDQLKKTHKGATMWDVLIHDSSVTFKNSVLGSTGCTCNAHLFKSECSFVESSHCGLLKADQAKVNSSQSRFHFKFLNFVAQFTQSSWDSQSCDFSLATQMRLEKSSGFNFLGGSITIQLADVSAWGAYVESQSKFILDSTLLHLQGDRKNSGMFKNSGELFGRNLSFKEAGAYVWSQKGSVTDIQVAKTIGNLSGQVTVMEFFFSEGSKNIIRDSHFEHAMSWQANDAKLEFLGCIFADETSLKGGHKTVTNCEFAMVDSSCDNQSTPITVSNSSCKIEKVTFRNSSGSFLLNGCETTVHDLQYQGSSELSTAPLVLVNGKIAITKSKISTNGLTEAIRATAGTVASSDNDYSQCGLTAFNLRQGSLESNGDTFAPSATRPAVLVDGATSNLPVSYDEETLQGLVNSLSKTIGLTDVKEKLKTQINVSKTLLLRRQKNSGPMRLIFKGNLGTGKTLISSSIGPLYYALNLTQFPAVERPTFAQIFNNEYRKSLVGKTVVIRAPASDTPAQPDAVWVKLLDELGPTTLVVLVDTASELEKFSHTHKSTTARFANSISFEDYTNTELAQITEQRLIKLGYSVSKEAIERCQNYFAHLRIKEAEKFSNAFTVSDLCQIVQERQANRIASGDSPAPEELNQVETADIPDGTNAKQKSLADSLAELDGLTGLDEVKASVKQFVALTQVNKRRGSMDLSTGMHLVFMGNPGTGKTTVARLIGDIYRGLGLLPSGHLVETDRSGLVGQYIGHTAEKTRLIASKAIGGVLFIDEAYALNAGIERDFGKEAVDTLLKIMEDRRADFAVIVAGYPKLMDNFFEMNPGMASRFSKKLYFADYKMDELISIFNALLAKNKFHCSNEVLNQVEKYLHSKKKPTRLSIGFHHDENDQSNAHFGNAREVRTLFEAMIELQALRLSSVMGADDWEFISDDVPIFG